MAHFKTLLFVNNVTPLQLFVSRLFSVTSVHYGFSGFKIRDKLHKRKAAQEFLFRLSDFERSILFEELQRLDNQASALQNVGNIHPPTSQQLRAVAVHNAMPFIGFGFLDNLIMIIAGDYIDATIGVTLGISTMAAAGLGNALSDVAGVGSAYYVETVASKIGVKSPPLTPDQITMARTRWCANLGRALGVTIGCVLGMFPLLFLSSKKKAVIESEK